MRGSGGWFWNVLAVVSAAGVILFCGLLAGADSRYRSGRVTYEKVRLEAYGAEPEADPPPEQQEDSPAPPAPGRDQGSSLPAVREAALKEQNEDYLFWLYIPGTEIDYPVVRHTDNLYYLNHMFDGEENQCGSIFADSGTDPGLGENTVVYGHNMKDGSMFGGLKKYREQQYYNDHPELWIFSGGRWIRGRIFACRTGSDDEMAVETACSAADGVGEYQERMHRRPLYDTGIVPEENRRLITLFTCYGSGKKLAVQAVLDVAEGENENFESKEMVGVSWNTNDNVIIREDGGGERGDSAGRPLILRYGSSHPPAGAGRGGGFHRAAGGIHR